MRAADDYRASQLSDYRVRPEAPGLYVGLNSQIWSWSLLAELGAIARSVAPTETLLVCDAMTGQDAVNVAESFVAEVDVTRSRGTIAKFQTTWSFLRP